MTDREDKNETNFTKYQEQLRKRQQEIKLELKKLSHRQSQLLNELRDINMELG